MNTWLLDTGPLVACLNTQDTDHLKAAEVLGFFRGKLVTTTTIVTETMHFMLRLDGGPELVARFLRAAEVEIVDFRQITDIERAVALMSKYGDTPMDFADATLVLLADALNQNHICTLDRRGFKTFRTSTGKRFTLVMDEA